MQPNQPLEKYDAFSKFGGNGLLTLCLYKDKTKYLWYYFLEDQMLHSKIMVHSHVTKNKPLYIKY